MKIAVISDVHSNLHALKLGLEDAEKCGVDKIFFLGDYITDGDNSNEVLDLVKKGDAIIMGNRERYILDFNSELAEFKNYRPIATIRRSLREENINFLKQLPQSLVIKVAQYKFLLVHGDKEFSSCEQLEEVFDTLIDKYDFDVCLFGHTHVYLHREYKGKIFLNPGSLGQPNDTPTYKYCTISLEDEIRVSQREFPVLNTYPEFASIYRASSYYRENVVWSEIILASIRDGQDHVSEFVQTVQSRTAKIKNINSKTFNDIWDNTYKDYKNKLK